MKIRDLLSWQSVVVWILAGLAGPAFSEVPGENANRAIRVGVIQSLTGFAAINGKSNLEALQLAAEEINKRSAEKIELIVEDDQTDEHREDDGQCPTWPRLATSTCRRRAPRLLSTPGRRRRRRRREIAHAPMLRVFGNPHSSAQPAGRTHASRECSAVSTTFRARPFTVLVHEQAVFTDGVRRVGGRHPLVPVRALHRVAGRLV